MRPSHEHGQQDSTAPWYEGLTMALVVYTRLSSWRLQCVNVSIRSGGPEIIIFVLTLSVINLLFPRALGF